MEWEQKQRNVWVTSARDYNVVLYSYETDQGESFFWDVFDSQKGVASGTAASLNDAQRLAEQQVRELGDRRGRIAAGNYPPGVPRTGG